MHTQVWAHRGASGYRPENTLDAFQLAVEQGADGVELDVQRSLDGVPVVAHDITVDRISEGTGQVGALTLAQLKNLNAAHAWSGYGIARFPTLAEVLALLRPTTLTLTVEIKNPMNRYPGLEAECTSLARDMGMMERIWFSSFQHPALLHIKEAAPESRCGLLYESTMVRPWLYAASLEMDALHPHYTELAVPGEAAHSHKLGIRVHAWTVNREAEMRWVADAGADALITNYPDVALRVLGRGWEDAP
jgi:glycerophosphoryl diester phosphodiesterase